MRKALKLKALMLLMAWMMIFAHNVIPHNHPEDCVAGCHELVHGTNPDRNDTGTLPIYRGQSEDINVCHISNLLFQQISQDNFFFRYDIELGLDPSVFSEQLPFLYTQEFISDPVIGSTSLRAPPVA